MIHKNTLPLEQQKIYSLLDFVKKRNFILFGGTALSLQIGHRISVDFDFFTKDTLDRELKELILKRLEADEIIQDEKNILVYKKNDVKFHFLEI